MLALAAQRGERSSSLALARDSNRSRKGPGRYLRHKWYPNRGSPLLLCPFQWSGCQRARFYQLRFDPVFSLGRKEWELMLMVATRMNRLTPVLQFLITKAHQSSGDSPLFLCKTPGVRGSIENEDTFRSRDRMRPASPKSIEARLSSLRDRGVPRESLPMMKIH